MNTPIVDECFPDIEFLSVGSKGVLEKDLSDALLGSVSLTSENVNGAYGHFHTDRFWLNMFCHTVRRHGPRTRFYVLEKDAHNMRIASDVNLFFCKVNHILGEVLRSDESIRYCNFGTVQEIRADSVKNDILFEFFLSGEEKFPTPKMPGKFRFEILYSIGDH